MHAPLFFLTNYAQIFKNQNEGIIQKETKQALDKENKDKEEKQNQNNKNKSTKKDSTLHNACDQRETSSTK